MGVGQTKHSHLHSPAAASHKHTPDSFHEKHFLRQAHVLSITLCARLGIDAGSDLLLHAVICQMLVSLMQTTHSQVNTQRHACISKQT